MPVRPELIPLLDFLAQAAVEEAKHRHAQLQADRKREDASPSETAKGEEQPKK